MVRDGYKFALPPLLLGVTALFLGWRGIAVFLLALGLLLTFPPFEDLLLGK